MTGERVRYVEAAGAARQAFRRAREAACSQEEHVTLEAVVSLTALYSKLVDEIAVAQVAELADLHPKNAARALRRLAALGVIAYVPGFGRGNVSRIGLPRAGEKGAHATPLSSTGKGSRSVPEKGADPDPKREPPTRARVRTEKYSEKVPEKLCTPEAVLAVFNATASTSFNAPRWLALIAARISEHPDLDLNAHRSIIERNFANPWWSVPTPSVLYARADVFERAIHNDGKRAPSERARRKSERIRALLSGGES